MATPARKRRRPARLVLIGAWMFVLGAAYAAVAPTSVQADGGVPAEIASGKALFTTNCSSCHGLNGEGTSQGPSLVGVGAAAVDFQVSTGRMPMAIPGAQAPRRTNTYSAEEIKAMAAYVQSLGPGPEIPKPEQYDPSGLTEEEIAQGGELFRTNCSACHNFAGQGGALPNGKYAPSLVGVSGKDIYEALRTGPQQMPVFSKGALSDTEVRQIIAYLSELHEVPNGGFTLGGLGPVSEGFWTWVLGIGGLSGFALWIASRGARAR